MAGVLDNLFFLKMWLNGELKSDAPRALELIGTGVTHSVVEGRSVYDLSALAVSGGGNLSNVFYVDAATAVAPENQNGSSSAPFQDLGSALSLAGDKTIFLAPGHSYTATVPTHGESVAIITMGAWTFSQNPKATVTLDFAPGSNVQMALMFCEVPAITGSPTTCVFYECNVGEFGTPVTPLIGASAVFAGRGGANFGNYGIGSVCCDNASFFGYYVIGPVQITPPPLSQQQVRVRDCDINGEDWEINEDATLLIDSSSLASARANGVVFDLNDTAKLDVIDARTRNVEFSFGGGTNQIVTVTASLSGCRVGDTFVANCTNLPAGAALGQVRCSTNGTLSAQIICIGTASSATLNVRVTRLTAAESNA